MDTILPGEPTHDYITLSAESVINGGDRMNKVVDLLEAERITEKRHHALAAYTGCNHNTIGNWVIVIGLCDGELYLKFQGRRDERYTLRHYHNNTFVWNLVYDEIVKRAEYCRPRNYYNLELEPRNLLDQSTENRITSIRWRHDASLPHGELFSKRE